MIKLEPTYLRYVYDRLDDGQLSSDNASALPHGFIGLFESEFPSDISVVERQDLLRRLSLWALFKGAVSTHLASEILEEDEEDTKTLIDTYSKWFNSPEPGKYILYHDRLRSYFLQKLSSHELQFLNEKLISHLEAKLKDDSVDEAQEYALAYLATHMAIESQLDNNYDRLHDFVNQEELWKRQVRVSKEYKWSQQAVQYGIKEGARRHQEMNTLTSTVNSVQLMQEEQKSSQQILDLLNGGDYQTALDRALSFKEENRFVIYLLMIHELTIGISKDNDFKELVCKKVIDSLNKNISIDIGIFNYKINFPVESIYAYHIALNKLNIQSNPIWERKDSTLKFIEYLVSQDLRFEQLLYAVNSITSLKIEALIILLDKYLTNIIYSIEIIMTDTNKKGESFYKLSQINDDYLRFIYSNISDLKIKNDEEKRFSNDEDREILSKKILFYLDIYEILVSFSNQIKKDIFNNIKINTNAKKYIQSNKFFIRDTLITKLEALGWANDLDFHVKFVEAINKDEDGAESKSKLIEQIYNLSTRYKLKDDQVYSHFEKISNCLMKAHAFDHVFKLYLNLLNELEKREFDDESADTPGDYYAFILFRLLALVKLVLNLDRDKAKNIMIQLKEVFAKHDLQNKFENYYNKNVSGYRSVSSDHLTPARDFLIHIISPDIIPVHYFDDLKNKCNVSSDFYVYYNEKENKNEEEKNCIQFSKLIDPKENVDLPKDTIINSQIRRVDCGAYKSIKDNQVIDFDCTNEGYYNLLDSFENSDPNRQALYIEMLRFTPCDTYQAIDSKFCIDVVLELEQNQLIEEFEEVIMKDHIQELKNIGVTQFNKNELMTFLHEYKIIKSLISKLQFKEALARISLVNYYVLKIDLLLEIFIRSYKDDVVLSSQMLELSTFEANNQKYSFRKSFSYLMIAQKLSSVGAIDEFKKIQNKITDEYHTALKDLFYLKLLIEKDEVERSVCLDRILKCCSSTIPECYREELFSALSSISRALIIKNKKEDAYTVNQLINSTSYRGSNILYFWEFYYDKDDTENADKVFIDLCNAIETSINDESFYEKPQPFRNDVSIIFLLNTIVSFSLRDKADYSIDILLKIFNKCSLTKEKDTQGAVPAEEDIIFDIIRTCKFLLENSKNEKLNSLIEDNLDLMLSNSTHGLKYAEGSYVPPFLNSVISYLYFVKKEDDLVKKYLKDAINALSMNTQQDDKLSEKIHLYSKCFEQGYDLKDDELKFVSRKSFYYVSLKRLKNLISQNANEKDMSSIFNDLLEYADDQLEYQNIYELIDPHDFPLLKAKIIPFLDDKYSFISANYHHFLKSRMKKFNEVDSEVESLYYDPFISYLVNEGRINDAITIVNNNTEKSSNHTTLCIDLVKNNKTDKAIEFINASYDKYEKDFILSTIAKVLVDKNDITSALSIIEIISPDLGEDSTKSGAYAEVSKKLFKEGKHKHSLEIADLITSEETAVEHYVFLCESSIEYAINNIILDIDSLLDPITQQWFKIAENAFNYGADSPEEIKSRYLDKVIDAYIVIANSFAKENNMRKYDEALQLAIKNIEHVSVTDELNYNWEDDSYCEFYIKIAKDLMKHGYSKESNKLVEKVLSITSSSNLTNIEFELKIWLNIQKAKELIVQGRKSESIELYKEAVKLSKDSKDSKKEYLMIASSIIDSYSTIDYIDTSLIDESLEVIKKANMDHNFYLKITKQLLDNNKNDHAFVLALQIFKNNNLLDRLKIRKDRIKRLYEINAPEIIIQNEEKLVKEVYYSLHKFFHQIIILFSDDHKIKELIEIHDLMMVDYNDSVGEENRCIIDETKNSLESQKSEEKNKHNDKFVKSLENIGDLMKSQSSLKLQLSTSLINNDISKIKLLDKVLDLSLIKDVVKI